MTTIPELRAIDANLQNHYNETLHFTQIARDNLRKLLAGKYIAFNYIENTWPKPTRCTEFGLVKQVYIHRKRIKVTAYRRARDGSEYSKYTSTVILRNIIAVGDTIESVMPQGETIQP